jgi:SAM-dependent methyltransferase
MAAARLRARLQRRRAGGQGARLELVRRHAAGRSFADIGCMYEADGAIAFAAEAAGADPVTAVDVSAPTPGYEAEHARRGSSVRFVRGNLHAPETLAATGEHDVVWCSGVLYHVPDPLRAIEALGSIASDRLILGSQTIPEVPGLPQAAVFWPGLDATGRSPYARTWNRGDATGITTPFRPDAGYANWFWGLTPSALEALLRSAGWTVDERLALGFDLYVVARRA